MIQTILQLLDEYKELKGITGKVNINEFLDYIRETIGANNMLYFYFDWSED